MEALGVYRPHFAHAMLRVYIFIRSMYAMPFKYSAHAHIHIQNAEIHRRELKVVISSFHPIQSGSDWFVKLYVFTSIY